MSGQFIMIWQIKIMDRNMDVCPLVICKEWILRQKSKSIGADVIHCGIDW